MGLSKKLTNLQVLEQRLKQLDIQAKNETLNNTDRSLPTSNNEKPKNHASGYEAARRAANRSLSGYPNFKTKEELVKFINLKKHPPAKLEHQLINTSRLLT